MIDFNGACDQNEICVDGSDPHYGFPMAYCVPLENFQENNLLIKYAKAALFVEGSSSGKPNSATAEIDDPPAALNLTAQAILTDSASTTSIKVDHLQISAGYKLAHYHSWLHGSLPKGVAQCDGCCDVQLYPIPQGTNELIASVKAATTVLGNLYLYTVQ